MPHAWPLDHRPMTNPTRPIHSSAPPQHTNFHKILRLLILIIYSAAPSATAQMSTNSSPPSGSSSSSVNPSTAIVVVVLFLSFFIMLFFSFYTRYCNPNPATSGGAAAAAPQRPSKPGLDPKVINTFPTFRFSDVKDFKFGEGRGTLECAVCIAEFVNDDAMRLLPKCNHVFHPDCIDTWLASHSTCPVCRADLTPSKNDLEQLTGSTQPNDLDRAENQNRSESQNQDQIAVDVEESGNREVQASELQKTKLVLRSHSTGHSLSHPGEDLERYTLRLPVELTREMMSPSNGNLKRTISCVVGKTMDERSRKARGGEERSGRGRSDRWVLTMTPPSLSRAPLVASPKVGFEGDLTAVGDFNRSFLATVRTPFECLAVKRDGVGQASTRPLV